MRDNITMMSDRDAKLHELQDKSTAFHATSEKFTGQAKTLQWRTKWQQYRLYCMIGTLILWALLLLPFRHHLAVYIPVSLVVMCTLHAAQHFLVKRWSPQMDKTQPLTSAADRNVE